MRHDSERKKDEGLDQLKHPGDESGKKSYPDGQYFSKPIDSPIQNTTLQSLPHDGDSTRDWLAECRKQWEGGGNEVQNQWTAS